MGEARLKWRRLLEPAVAMLVLAGRGSGAELLLDPWRTPGLAAELVAEPGRLKAFERVHLLACSGAQTLWPTKVAPFTQTAAAEATPLEALTQACRTAGVKVSWAVDLLQWERPDLASTGLFKAHPEWLALDRLGRAWMSPAKVASPFRKDVREALAGLLEELAAQTPPPDGLTIALRLSDELVLGCEPAARAAHIRELAIDPADLMEPEELAPWMLWREGKLTDLLAELLGRWRAGRPDLPVAAWGTAGYYVQPADRRGCSADHWLKWLDSGRIDEVLLDGTWHLPANATIWPRVAQLAAQVKAAEPGRFRPLVRSRDGAGEAILAAELAAIEAQGAPTDQAVYLLLDEADAAAAWPKGAVR